MPQPRKPLTNQELIQALARLFDSLEPDTPKEIAETLRGAGYDPAEVAERMHRMATEAMTKACKTEDTV